MQDWDSIELWRRHIERRLNEIGSSVKGNQDFQADRIADLLEQLEEIRTRQDKMAAWIKAKFSNGGETK